MPQLNPPFIILVGTNGTGKTSKIKKLLEIYPRNLVLPANGFDPGWKNFNFKWLLEVKKGWKAVQMSSDVENVKDKPVYTIPGIQKFDGLAIIKPEHRDLGFKEVLETVLDPVDGFIRGGLTIDDFKNYIKSSGTLPNSVTSYLTGRRHRDVGIYMACHGWSHINRELLDFNPTLLIHKTKSPPHGTMMAKIDEDRHEEFNAMIKRVNDHPSMFYCESFEL